MSFSNNAATFIGGAALVGSMSRFRTVSACSCGDETLADLSAANGSGNEDRIIFNGTLINGTNSVENLSALGPNEESTQTLVFQYNGVFFNEAKLASFLSQHATTENGTSYITTNTTGNRGESFCDFQLRGITPGRQMMLDVSFNSDSQLSLSTCSFTTDCFRICEDTADGDGYCTDICEVWSKKLLSGVATAGSVAPAVTAPTPTLDVPTATAPAVTASLLLSVFGMLLGALVL